MMRIACLTIALCAFSIAVAPRAWAAAFVVNSTADAVDVAPGDGACVTAAATCTLRAAIQEANALSGGDSITLAAGIYTLGILGAGEDAAATGDLDITGDLSITGATTGQTIISGAGIDRVFDILSPAVVSLSRLTVQSGNASAVAAAGGGIRNAGTLNLSLLTLVNNTANGDGGGLANLSGGNARLTNVTLTGNRSLSPVGLGGGIANDMGAVLQLTNVTVNGNSANQGGGVDNLGNVQAVNTIIANSLAASTCAGAAITSLGHNLDSSMTCFFPTGAGDLQNKDPKLDTLLDTGSTFVFPLKTGSPAIDAGDNLNCPPTDQRGQLRPADGNGDAIYICDIGAYEVAGPVLPTPTASPTGTATSTPSPPTPTSSPPPTSTPAGGSISLSRVIGHPGEQVVFGATLSAKGASIAKTQNDIAFDSTNAPVAPLANGAPDCSVNLQIGKEATSFAFQPQGCSGAACTAVHASVMSAINNNAIADGTLYTCKVTIAPGTAAGEYPLTISALVLQGPDGQPLPNPVGSSGAIVVVIPTPTPTPGPADCCQCSTPAVCGPATGGCGSCVVVFGASCDGSTGQCVTATTTPSATRTSTPLTTSTATQTSSPTLTPTPSVTTTATSIMTSTATVTAVVGTATATNTVLLTATPTTPDSPTLTPTSSPTTTPTALPTAPPTTSETPTATLTATPEATAATPTTSATTSVSATATDTATATPRAAESATETATPREGQTVTPTEPGTATLTASPSLTPTATPTMRPCPGDCDHSGNVTITDVVTMIDLALQSPPTTGCAAGDISGDGQITIDEILVAVHSSLSGCPAS